MLIKELCSDYFWIMPKTPKYTEGAKIPYITSKNLRNGSIDYSNCKYVTEDDFNKLSTKRCILENDFLISMIGTLGEVAIVSKDDLPIYGQNMYLLRPDFSKVSKKYLFYFLTSSYLKQKLLNITNGATQSYLHDTDIINQSIQNRTIEEQNSISHELDSIMNALSAKKRELESLNELIKSQFIEMFGDPNTNDKKWDKGIINDIGTCIAGATPSTKINEYWENGTIPWMSSGEVHKERIYETDTKITQLGYKNASTKLVPPHTVVLAMAGQGKTRGTAAIAEIELCTNQSICSIVNNEKVNPEFLLFFLKMQYLELRNASNGADGRGGLNLKIIGNYPIVIPPRELQDKFAHFVEQIDKSKFIVQKQIDDLQELLDSKMQEYFGEEE